MIWKKTSTNINDLFWVLQICLLSSNRQLILRFPKNSIPYYPLKTARPPKHNLFWNSVSKEIPTNIQPISEHQSKNHHMFIIYVINMFTDSSVTSYFTYHFCDISSHSSAKQQLNSLWKFNIAPEKWWLEDYFPIGKVTFQGRAVKLREGIWFFYLFVFTKVWPFYSPPLPCPKPRSTGNQSLPEPQNWL